mmetsp:Transcript_23944/g.33256  ORF Transcript_23944/g.33256 Transcript_23944/m.33256 type:complete len:541 (-) Transcript_23944:46-1668(-)|eukprot:jgi/Bigna1/53094/estExt_Genewise1Plus.C_150126
MSGKNLKIGKYVLGKTLGKGATGLTKIGLDPKTGERIALKIIYLDVNKDERKKRIRAFETEYKMLKTIAHKNVLKLKFMDFECQVPQPNGSSKLACVLGLELAMNGELMDHLLSAGKFSEIVGRTIFHSLVEGLSACHNAGIAHRDLKPENILLDKDFVVKIADFGFSRLAPKKGMETQVGTLAYMAPEVLSGIPYTQKTDVWSLGVILFILLVGYPPYSSPSKSDYWWHALVTQRNLDRFWAGHQKVANDLDLSRELQSLLGRLLEVSVRNRYDLSQIKAHPWYQEKILPQENLAKALADRKSLSQGEMEQMLTKGQEVTNSKPGEHIIYRDVIDPDTSTTESSVNKRLKEAISKESIDAILRLHGEKAPLLKREDAVGGRLQVEVQRIAPLDAYRKLAEVIGQLGKEVRGLEYGPGLRFEITTIKDKKECSFEATVYSDGEGEKSSATSGQGKEGEKKKVENEEEEVGEERRLDTSDGKYYTLEDFTEMYGPMEGEEIWEKAPLSPKEGSVVVFRRLGGDWRDFGRGFARIRLRLQGE